MIGPEIGQAIFRVAFFIAFVSGLLLLVLDPHSAEFVVAALSLGVGLVFILVIALLVRRQLH